MKVELGFQFQSADVDQNGPAVALYTVKGMPKGGKIVLQRAFGTANKFKVVTSSTQTSGAFSITAPPMGQYTYRLLVTDKNGKRIAWGDQKLRAYGDVPFATMLDTSTRTREVAGTMFRYSIITSWGDTERSWDSTSCRSFTIQAASTGRPTSAPGTVTITQEAADQTIIEVPGGQIVGATVGIAPGSVKMYLEGNGYVMVDGVGSCYTRNGKA
jgi:hypothetical protein